MIASKVNEDQKLSQIPGNKSLNMRLLLNTMDSHVSPVIDGQRTSIILSSNRVNDVITDYSTEDRVSTLGADPTACQYISKEIQQLKQDLKTLEKAVYKSSQITTSSNPSSNSLNEDILTRHLLKLNEIETQFQNLRINTYIHIQLLSLIHI